MSKKFVIGDRVKDEWISVLDTEKKKLEFTNHLASAKEYILEEDAQIHLQQIQETGYFSDLQIYLKDDNKAYKIDERDTL
jgi:outer membrane protein assembly factor BamA